MSSVRTSTLGPGLIYGAFAGAAGTTALNIIGFLDIALRGRAASTTPERTVDAILGLFGLGVPGTGDVHADRLAGLGALTGYAAGLGIGMLLGIAYSQGWRPKPLLAVTAATILALVATNGPMTILGVTNPLTWGVVGWVSDLIPHIGYGAVTAWGLHHFYVVDRVHAPVAPSDAVRVQPGG